MLKNILNLDGVQELSNGEQKAINGGIPIGCAFQYWTGTSLTNCKTTNPGGYSYYYSNGNCRAYFCGSPILIG